MVQHDYALLWEYVSYSGIANIEPAPFDWPKILWQPVTHLLTLAQILPTAEPPVPMPSSELLACRHGPIIIHEYTDSQQLYLHISYFLGIHLYIDSNKLLFICCNNLLNGFHRHGHKISVL